MKFKDKKIYILKELYDRKFDGNNYDLEKLNEELSINRDEALQIGKSLSDSGLIKIIATKDGVHRKIFPLGIEFIEEEKFIETTYSPNDPFNTDEKIKVIRRLDEFGYRLSKIEKGQEVIYDDISEQIDELKELINVLGKKDWSQAMKGKLIDAGYGALVSKAGDLLLEIFKKQDLLGG